MATIGSQLLAPESSWQRLDNTDSKIVYTGSGWLMGTHASYYNSSYRHNGANTVAGNAICSFKFKGTKLRVIGFLHTGGCNARVTIDGVNYPYNTLNSTTKYQILVFEKLGLTDTIHTIEITNTTNGYIDIDAIDIDSTGYLVTPVGTQLLAPETGWQRIDDSNTKINYDNGTWSISSTASLYNSTQHYTNSTSASVSFSFFGTKFRIIDTTNSDRANNIQVYIDNVLIESYTTYRASLLYQVLVYEKLNLTESVHTVKLVKNATGYFSLDAIDIDSTGYLLTMLDRSFTSSNITLSNNYLTSSNGVDRAFMTRATLGRSTGKWYWEVKVGSMPFTYGVEGQVGIASADQVANDPSWYLTTKKRWAMVCGVSVAATNMAAYFYNTGTAVSGYGACFQNNDIVGIALDLDSNPKTVKFYVNNVYRGMSNTVPGDVIYPMAGQGTYTFNFGALPFTYTIPSGYQSWDTQPFTIKYLFKDGNDIKYFSGSSWLTSGVSPITENMFTINGMTSIASIDKTELDLLTNNNIEIMSFEQNTITSRTLTINYTPNPELILPTGDINIESIQNIDSFNLVANQSGTGLVKVIISKDSGATWQAFNGSNWINIDIENLSEVETNGMAVSLFNALTSQQIMALIGNSNVLRFGYYLEINEVSDVANTNSIAMTVDMQGKWKKAIVGTDYRYSYPESTILKVQLFSNGDYKINY